MGECLGQKSGSACQRYSLPLLSVMLWSSAPSGATLMAIRSFLSSTILLLFVLDMFHYSFGMTKVAKTFDIDKLSVSLLV